MLRSGAFTGDSSECEDICNSISANTVASVDTACDFTCSVEAGDDIAVAVNDLCVFIDDDAAHCMVTFHRDTTGIERSLDDLVDQNAFCTAERIFLGINSFVVRVDCFFQVVCRYTDLPEFDSGF